MRVQLSIDELRVAAMVGVDRQIAAIQKNLHHTFPLNGNENSYSIHIQGAIAEMATAKALDVQFEPHVGGRDNGYDIANRFCVRSTKYPTGSLILYNGDPDDAYHVLAIIETETVVRLAGWIEGNDGKQQRYYNVGGRRHAYWIEQQFLQPMEHLVNWVRLQRQMG